MLEVDDPALASRLAWTDDGRIVERDAVERDAWVKLLRWDRRREDPTEDDAEACVEKAETKDAASVPQQRSQQPSVVGQHHRYQS